jgi:hypothetical protein
MATSQWDNFLRNLGEWQGSFCNLNADGLQLETTPSILTLEQDNNERLVRFRLRRYGAGGYSDEPIRDYSQEYRSLGRQVMFFETGSFSKGSLQLAPGTAFGAEFGFVEADRRHRLVQLFSPAGAFESLVLIRESRAGSQAPERPPLAWGDLVGHWSGQAATLTAAWPEPELAICEIQIEQAEGAQIQIQTQIGELGEAGGGANTKLLLLPDSGYSLVPPQLSHRQAFVVEAGWLAAPDRLERLIRRYDASGAWLSATQIIATRSQAR